MPGTRLSHERGRACGLTRADRLAGVITRADAEHLDTIDPLAPWLDEFVIDGDGGPGGDGDGDGRDGPARLIYLDGNSLGRAPKRTLERVQQVMREDWARGLIRSWDHWVDLPAQVGDRLAGVIGAGPGEVLVHDSTTVDIYQLVHAALGLRPDRTVIAVDAGDFPTDRYVVDGIAAATGRTVRHGFDDLDDVAVVLRSLVDYRTAEVADLVGETARADAAGTLTIWDLSHAGGVLAVDLRGAGVQLAVGCTYKFLNGGPGSPAYTYVARELQDAIRQPIWGWWSQQDMFAMGLEYRARTDIGRFHLGTPSILALTAADVGISLSAEAGIENIQTKARALTGFAIDLCDELGLATCTPRDPERRGGHVAVVHPQAKAVTAALIARGVIPDFREPDIVRLGMSPLTTTFVDVFDGLVAVAEEAANLSG